MPEPAGDPTPLAKCRVAASESNPLVTEWPASEKAHLQSLADRHAVAVEYSGCELRIISECELPGRYVWHRTTLATDTIDIRSADELYAKLPIGAVALEAELARSGRLAVQTTVAGQLRMELASDLPMGDACRGATHIVSAISVGTFKLLSGVDSDTGGGVGVMGVGAGARQSSAKSVLRTAGDPERCGETSNESAHVDCASPIQLFLTKLDRGDGGGSATRGEGASRRPSAGDVQLSFPAPDNESERWSLRDADGVEVCQLPCTASVPRVSGYSLRRERPLAELPFPGKLYLPAGSSGYATYRAERGSPILSKLNFYLMGIPTAGVAVGFGIWGIAQSDNQCEDALGRPDDCFPGSGFLFLTAGMNAAIAGASTWWFLYSHDAELTLSTSPTAKARPAVDVGFGPGGLHGTF